MDTINYIDVRKFEALALYYMGKSKSSICKKLSIKNRLLTKWINSDTKTIKDKALHLFCFGMSIDKICKIIYVDKTFLKKWIQEMHLDIAFNAIEKDLNELNDLSRRQNGYSKWLDNYFGN
jgi:transposase